MKGYVARKGNRWYAVVYEGIDPGTGRERRKWHPAGTERADAKRLAARLAAELEGRNDEARSLTFGVYLTARWLPAKRVVLAETTYEGYRRNIEHHVLPVLGHVGLRRLRPQHLEALYAKLLHRGRPPTLPGAVGRRVHRHAPQRTPRPPLGRLRRRRGDAVGEPRARLRRLRDPRDPREDHQRTPTHRRRSHDGRRARRLARVAGSPAARRGHRKPRLDVHDAIGEPIHPHSISQSFERIARGAAVRVIRLHDVRHTHATLLIAAGVPVKVVTERLGHAMSAFTIDSYQHVLPGMQAEAARCFERLIVGGLPPVTTKSEKTR